jgi:hypothetical protein
MKVEELRPDDDLAREWHFCPKCPLETPGIRASAMGEHDEFGQYLVVICPTHGPTGWHDVNPNEFCWCEK